MAQRRVQVNMCDSCFKDTEASTTIKYSWGENDYEIDLCEKHADAMTRDMLGWIRLSREKERPSVFRSREEVRALTAKLTPTATSAPVSSAQAEEPAFSHYPAPASLQDNWRLSRHAEEQLASRGPEHGFGRADVFAACTNPERAIQTHDGCEIRVYGNVSIVANPRSHRVVTVLPRTTRDLEPKQEVLEIASH